MKRFIAKSVLFILPFFILHIITSLFYTDSANKDLLRIGLIPNIYKNYRDIFKRDNDEKYKYVKLSETKNKNFKIMTIGDSFSNKGADGYNNFLAEDFSVLHIDRFVSKNPIQTLINLSNGNFFDHYKIKFVILQNVERHLIDNIKDVEKNKKFTLNDIDSILENREINMKTYRYDFFSRTTLKFPLYTMPKYFFSKNYLSNNAVYNYDLNNNSAFSNFSNKLLFYHVDLSNTEQNNNIENCIQLNNILNDISLKLKKKNIQLIFLPSPDKYDMYYDMIIENKKLPKPYFFNNFDSLKKNFIYIDTKSLLLEYIYEMTDLYFYDDTHWSPVASKIIAEKIKEVINKHEKFQK
ncbi:MAG: hypothetical protein RQ735_09245 [Flavobacteriaceae bacterium]|nr:hypothetical protein [Flavobacteriaceae bacterium]